MVSAGIRMAAASCQWIRHNSSDLFFITLRVSEGSSVNPSLTRRVMIARFAEIKVHPTEACVDPRIEVIPGMSAVSHDLMKNRPRRTEIRRNPAKSAEDRRHHGRTAFAGRRWRRSSPLSSGTSAELDCVSSGLHCLPASLLMHQSRSIRESCLENLRRTLPPDEPKKITNSAFKRIPSNRNGGIKCIYRELPSTPAERMVTRYYWCFCSPIAGRAVISWICLVAMPMGRSSGMPAQARIVFSRSP